MSKPYLRELHEQLALVEKKIAALEEKSHYHSSALAARFRREDVSEANKLIARRKTLEQRIIDYEP
jgi:hypothetical protein